MCGGATTHGGTERSYASMRSITSWITGRNGLVRTSARIVGARERDGLELCIWTRIKHTHKNTLITNDDLGAIT